MFADKRSWLGTANEARHQELIVPDTIDKPFFERLVRRVCTGWAMKVDFGRLEDRLQYRNGGKRADFH